jgi:HEAT repeat protein
MRRRLSEREIIAGWPRTSDPSEQLSRITILAKVGTDASVPLLGDALASAHGDIRAVAAIALGRIDTIAAVDALIAGVAAGDSIVVTSAADALGSLRVRRAVPVLIDVLSRPRRAGAHAQAANWAVIGALGRMRAPASVDVLANYLVVGDWYERRLAASALDRINSADSRRALEDACERMSWWRGRWARRALKRRNG